MMNTRQAIHRERLKMELGFVARAMTDKMMRSTFGYGLHDREGSELVARRDDLDRQDQERKQGMSEQRDTGGHGDGGLCGGRALLPCTR